MFLSNYYHHSNLPDIESNLCHHNNMEYISPKKFHYYNVNPNTGNTEYYGFEQRP